LGKNFVAIVKAAKNKTHKFNNPRIIGERDRV
jgi:hypothetical protein